MRCAGGIDAPPTAPAPHRQHKTLSDDTGAAFRPATAGHARQGKTSKAGRVGQVGQKPSAQNSGSRRQERMAPAGSLIRDSHNPYYGT